MVDVREPKRAQGNKGTSVPLNMSSVYRCVGDSRGLDHCCADHVCLGNGVFLAGLETETAIDARANSFVASEKQRTMSKRRSREIQVYVPS